jgi:hypothetical protein
MMGLHGADLQWLAEIWDDKTEEYLPIGTYKDEKDAARAYDRACLREHGGNANTNFPAAQYEEADAREDEETRYRTRHTFSDWDMDPEDGDAAEGTALVRAKCSADSPLLSVSAPLSPSLLACVCMYLGVHVCVCV